MDASIVFSSRPVSNFIGEITPFHQIAMNALNNRLREKLNVYLTAPLPDMQFQAIDCNETDDTSGILIVDSTEPCTASAAMHDVETTNRAAAYAEYMGFIQSLYLEYMNIESSASLRSYGFSSQDERDNEVQRLAHVWQDLRYVIAHNISNPFNKDERDAIMQIID